MRKTSIIILVMIISSIVIVFSCYNRVENELNESTAISSSYNDGYFAGSEDYNRGFSFRKSVRNDFDNMIPIYKLAYDAGYAYGWVDALNGTPIHSERGFEYSPLTAPDFMYKIYWLLK